MSAKQKERKRLSRIIKVEFGKEVGISLEELELEFDDLMNAFEQESADDTGSIPRNDEPDKPTLSSSTTSLNRKPGRLKDMLNCTKSRSSTIDSTTSHDPHSADTRSLDFELDVFSSTDDLSDDRGIEFVALRGKKSPAHQTMAWLNKRIPGSPRHNADNKSRQCSDKHVLTPPVLVDGAPTSSYQYLTPTICKEQKSSTLSKLMTRPPEYSNRRRPKESPLKAMYEATVRGDRVHTASTS